jgi:uncharacterized protein
MEDRPVSPPAAGPLEPTSPDERIPALDIIRGFALLGVLLAYTLWNLGNAPDDTYSRMDRLLDTVLTALIDTKFYTTFAFLFGVGFAIQLTRARARGAAIVLTYCRRLLALLAIGLAHALLLRNGDILVPYAVMGFVLLPFRNASTRTLAIGATVGLLFPYLARGAWELAGLPFPQRPGDVHASYLAVNAAWVRYWYSTALFFWPASLPMFLLGLSLGANRFFENLPSHERAIRRALAGGLSVGVLAYAGRAWLASHWPGAAGSFEHRLVLGLLWTAHAWGLATFYMSALVLLIGNPAWRRRLAPVGAVGRMALTNYLLQAALVVPVCVAFDLFNRITPGVGLLLALMVWSVEVPVSSWWFARFRFGPAEWLWRSLTYGRAQPMRIEQRGVAATGA